MKLRVSFIDDKKPIDLVVPNEDEAHIKWVDILFKGVYNSDKKEFIAPNQIKGAKIVE